MKKSMYGMNNYVKLFYDELKNWLTGVAGFRKSHCQMSIYYKYAPDWSKLVVLYYVDDCVYWYTYEELEKWFWGKPGNRFHMNFLVYVICFMSIRIYQLKYQSISADQDKYATFVVSKYLNISTIKENPNTIKLHCLMIWCSPKNMPPPVMRKWKHFIDSKIFITELVWNQ